MCGWDRLPILLSGPKSMAILSNRDGCGYAEAAIPAGSGCRQCDPLNGFKLRCGGNRPFWETADRGGGESSGAEAQLGCGIFSGHGAAVVPHIAADFAGGKISVGRTGLSRRAEPAAIWCRQEEWPHPVHSGQCHEYGNWALVRYIMLVRVPTDPTALA